jgi:hypothetical protein
MKHDLRWLLWFAWPCFGVAIWWLARRTREVLVVSILGTALTGAGLLLLSRWLKPEQASIEVPTLKPVVPVTGQTNTPQRVAKSPKATLPKKKPPEQPLPPAVGPSTSVRASPQAAQPNVNAPYGIAIGGGTVSNPTVNNYGPPPPRIRWLVVPLETAKQYLSQPVSASRPATVVKITFEGMMEHARFAFVCDRPCEGGPTSTWAAVNGSMGISGVGGWLKQPTPIPDNPYSVEFIIFGPDPVSSGEVIWFSIYSMDDTPVTVTELIRIVSKQP